MFDENIGLTLEEVKLEGTGNNEEKTEEQINNKDESAWNNRTKTLKSNNDRLTSQGREDKKIPERRAFFDTDNSSGVEIASGVVSTPTKSQSAVKSFTIPEKNVNLHLDRCLIRSEKEETMRKCVIKRKPLPKYVYSLMKDKELRKKMAELGLPTDGDRQTLIKRHQELILRYNAKCDSLNPKSVKRHKSQFARLISETKERMKQDKQTDTEATSSDACTLNDDDDGESITSLVNDHDSEIQKKDPSSVSDVGEDVMYNTSTDNSSEDVVAQTNSVPAMDGLTSIMTSSEVFNNGQLHTSSISSTDVNLTSVLPDVSSEEEFRGSRVSLECTAHPVRKQRLNCNKVGEHNPGLDDKTSHFNNVRCTQSLGDDRDDYDQVTSCNSEFLTPNKRGWCLVGEPAGDEYPISPSLFGDGASPKNDVRIDAARKITRPTQQNIPLSDVTLKKVCRVLDNESHYFPSDNSRDSMRSSVFDSAMPSTQPGSRAQKENTFTGKLQQDSSDADSLVGCSPAQDLLVSPDSPILQNRSNRKKRKCCHGNSPPPDDDSKRHQLQKVSHKIRRSKTQKAVGTRKEPTRRSVRCTRKPPKLD
ncbi:hypothetical protein LSH36_895g00026 [Paralvinella palmiformis]|uniref:SAP domain-containing protein n=1 Tax=Paralvinella palmiformis TaxID=53620 RepID=A0AAD9IYI3_9ANNE|nr:hypothetical protein LSH36_895g00026 [Paralvinella palmiformis]